MAFGRPAVGVKAASSVGLPETVRVDSEERCSVRRMTGMCG